MDQLSEDGMKKFLVRAINYSETRKKFRGQSYKPFLAVAYSFFVNLQLSDNLQLTNTDENG